MKKLGVFLLIEEVFLNFFKRDRYDQMKTKSDEELASLTREKWQAQNVT